MAADLSALEVGELEREAKREALRDQRQERIASALRSERRRAREALEERHRIGLFHLLVVAAICSMTVITCGLLQGEVEMVKAGLLALCAICGGSLFQIGIRG
jgi:hypothetical protein